MSTSLLHDAFGIVGYMYIDTRYENGTVIFKIAHNQFNFICSCCGSKRVLRRGTIMRRFKSIPIGLKPVFIEIELQRVLCLACKVVRQVKLSFAKWRRTYTKAFERYALMLSKFMTVLVWPHICRSVGEPLRISKKRYLKRRYLSSSLKYIHRIVIGEISIGKSHRYPTVVLNLGTRAAIYVGDGKYADALSPFFQRLIQCES